MPLSLMSRVPLGCWFGAAIVVMGLAAGDWRGVFVGVVVFFVTLAGLWRSRRDRYGSRPQL